MRTFLCGCLISVLANGMLQADDQPPSPPPLVARYLESGELSSGAAALEAALVDNPTDDQLRFGLGFLQLLRAVERFGQSSHEYGAKTDIEVAFLRVPVPENPAPSSISHQQLRRTLDDFRRDLSIAESTLAAIRDETVTLPVRLMTIRLDLDCDGEPTDQLIDVIRQVTRQRLLLLETNPDFRICLDRGDVAWLRAYCHLLMAMLDGVLAIDGEPFFNQYAQQWFAKPIIKNGDTPKVGTFEFSLDVVEPARLSRLRYHLLQVCELNRETWKYIRAETDDDDEWLPNSKQKGVLGLPVRDQMVDQWLRMVAEMESILNGTKLVPFPIGGRMLSVKKLLDDPPARLDAKILEDRADNKYLERGQPADLAVLLRAFQQFDDPFTVGYAAWFN